jgi:hypothetical protein
MPIETAQGSTGAVEQNTTKRRGIGLRAFDSGRACPGFTLFAPLIWGDGTVYLIDLHGNVVHTWIPVEARCSDRRWAACPDSIGERQHPHLRQRRSSPR